MFSFFFFFFFFEEFSADINVPNKSSSFEWRKNFYLFIRKNSRIVDVSNRANYSLSRIVLRGLRLAEDKVSLPGHSRMTCNVRGLADDGASENGILESLGKARKQVAGGIARMSL